MSGIQGYQLQIAFKNPCRVATTGNIVDLAAGAPNSVDGVSLAQGDRVLVKDQGTGSQNGIYSVATVGTGADGAWVRALDFGDVEEDGLTAGVLAYIQQGTAHEKTYWSLVTTGTLILDTTALVFTKALTVGAPASIVGTTGSTDNALLRADGTGGSTLQGSGATATLSDTGNLVVTSSTGQLPGHFKSTVGVTDIDVTVETTQNSASSGFRIVNSSTNKSSGFRMDSAGNISVHTGGTAAQHLESGVLRALWDTTGSLVLGAPSTYASAKLAVDSTSKGFAPPRMTAAQRDSIGTPLTGLLVFNTTAGVPSVRNTNWRNLITDLVGVSGGQTIIGDTVASGSLILDSTSDVSKGYVKLNTGSTLWGQRSGASSRGNIAEWYGSGGFLSMQVALGPTGGGVNKNWGLMEGGEELFLGARTEEAYIVSNAIHKGGSTSEVWSNLWQQGFASYSSAIFRSLVGSNAGESATPAQWLMGFESTSAPDPIVWDLMFRWRHDGGMDIVGVSLSPPVSATDEARIYVDTDTDDMWWSVNGAAYRTFAASVAVEAKTATYGLNPTIDREKVFTNEGATTVASTRPFNLPTAVAGLVYEFIVQDSDGIRVVASSGDTIRDGATVSAAAGNIESTTVGDTLRLVAINATEWIAAPAVGSWTLT